MRRGYEIMWYIPPNFPTTVPFQKHRHTSSIAVIRQFSPDIIFVPGNEVPWYLRGVKVQVFHGLAGEKKGHFRLRGFFDLYLTPGPFFTTRFKELAQKYCNFTVYETGWCKLDPYISNNTNLKELKKQWLLKTKAQSIILYAPTFSPSLTSASLLLERIKELGQDPQKLILVKFHDKICPQVAAGYENITKNNIIIIKDSDLTPYIALCDIMISDTSSAVYEAILFDKPVITFNSISPEINWVNICQADQLIKNVEDILTGTDKFKSRRKKVMKEYHPYFDGLSSSRMLDQVINYINTNGVPENRKISFTRKLATLKKYGLKR